MKALVLKNVGKIGIEEIDKPSPKQGEVLVHVKCCGICGSDINRAYTDGAHNMPLVIGHEFSGEVVEVGKDVSESWIGKAVGVFPLIPCKECDCCKKRKYEMCRSYSYLGSRRDGGFAEYVAVPEWNLIELSEDVSYDKAAMLEPMAVAVHAIRNVWNDKLDVKKTNVVVMGLGTIGLFVTMFLLDMGMKSVYVIGNKELQKSKAIELGVPEDNYFDVGAGDVVEWINVNTNSVGADVFFECVGKKEALETGIKISAPMGRICTLGNPHSDMDIGREMYWRILRNQLTLVGTWNSSFTHEDEDDWHYVIRRLQQGKLSPEKLITHKFRLENIINGFEIMREKNEGYIKVMCELSE